jgi:uncharacterized integral membrane protein
MKFFFGLAFLVLLGAAIFAVQNSTAPAIDIKFLVWHIQTSLVYTILGTLVSGMIVVFLLWIPSAFRSSSQKRGLRKEVEIVGKTRKRDLEECEQRSKDKEA